MNISRGIIPTAKKVVIYGPEGIGKSTFAAKFPRAVFIDTEGSTSNMDVARVDPPQRWQDILDAVDWFLKNPGELGTLVIDTIDWAEALAFRAVCEDKKVGGIEDIPYGKGYTFAKDKIRTLLDKLSALKDLGVNVVLVAHAIISKFEQPDELGSYDRFALKLNQKNIAPLVKEWADLLLFANYRTDVVTTQDGKKKATGGKKRVMYTERSACWDAKNRFGLEDPLPFDFEPIAHLFDVAPAAVPAPEPAPVQEAKKPRKKAEVQVTIERPASMVSEDPEKDKALARLWELMKEKRVADVMALQTVVADKGYYPLTTLVRDYDLDFIRDVLIEAWDDVSKAMMSIINDLPF